MNDAQIRQHLHRKRLRRSHASPSTLVIDELGLFHGDSRADVVVVNGHLAGYEIKSDDDSLRRLDEQVVAYSSVFDRVSIVTGEKHARDVRKAVPKWWGILVARRGLRGGISFETVRRGRFNHAVDPVAVAHLLWRDEALRVLEACGVKGRMLRGTRRELYEELSRTLSRPEIRRWVRLCLKQRANWRHPLRPSPSGGSFRPASK
jgi:hypothetical protein